MIALGFLNRGDLLFCVGGTSLCSQGREEDEGEKEGETPPWRKLPLLNGSPRCAINRFSNVSSSDRIGICREAAAVKIARGRSFGEEVFLPVSS